MGQINKMSKILAECKNEEKHVDDVMTIAIWKNFIFTGSYDGIINKWNLNLELQLTWKAHDICVYSLVCDENRLFSSSSHGEIKEWDPETGKFRQMTILEGSVTGKAKPTEVRAMSLNHGQFWVGDDQGNLIEYGENFVAKKKKLIYTEIWSLALAPDGTNLICARDNDCNIYDLELSDFSREEFQTTLALQGSVRGRAPVLVDENHILCVDQSGGMNIKVYDYKDKDYSQKCNLQDGHDMIINALLLSSKSAVSAGWDGKLVLWDLETKKQEQQYQCDSYINTLAWLDSEKKQILAGGKSGFLVKVQM